jgi:hypothetical protein
MEERIHLVERSSQAVKLMRPDLMVEHSGGFSRVGGVSAVLEVEPLTIPVAILEEVREVYLEITHRPERSPSSNCFRPTTRSSRVIASTPPSVSPCFEGQSTSSSWISWQAAIGCRWPVRCRRETLS